MKRVQRIFGDLDSLRYVDGRLDEERRAAFVSYLAEHPEEAERVAIWTRQDEMIRAAFSGVTAEPVPMSLRTGALTPPARLAAQGLAAVSRPAAALHAVPANKPFAASMPPGTRSRMGRFRTAAAYRVPLSAAALCMVAALVITIAHGLAPAAAEHVEMIGPASEDPLSPLTARAYDAHETFAIDPLHPAEFPATEIGRLEVWARQRLGTTMAVPDLLPDGWRLLGGRLVPGTRGPATLLIYQDSSGDRLSLLASQDEPPMPSVALRAFGSGTASVRWSQGDTSYVVTVGKPLDWLSHHAESLRTRVNAAVRGAS